MLGLLVFIAFFLLFLFRWKLFEKVIGTANMYLLDAVMWTIYAAYCFATPPGGSVLKVVNIAFGALGIWWAIRATKNYRLVSEIIRKVKEKNEQQNQPPSSGSNSGAA